MGWNELLFSPGAHPLLAGLIPGDHAYFVHSYALAGGNPAEIIATTDYGAPVVAMVATPTAPAPSSTRKRASRLGCKSWPISSPGTREAVIAGIDPAIHALLSDN